MIKLTDIFKELASSFYRVENLTFNFLKMELIQMTLQWIWTTVNVSIPLYDINLFAFHDL
jgi:hypothetical protein